MPMVVPLPMPTMMTTVTTTTIVMTVIDCNNDNDHDRRQTTERAVSSGPPKCPDAIKSYFYVYSCSVLVSTQIFWTNRRGHSSSNIPTLLRRIGFSSDLAGSGSSV